MATKKLDTTGHKTEGNTNPRSRKWCLTLNNYTESEYNNIKNWMEKHQYIIGKEIGTQGTPHLQMYVESNNPIKFTTIKNVCERCHIERAHGTQDQNIKYCSKDNNYITNFIIPEPIRVIEPSKQWQKEIINLIEGDWDDRKINWYYDLKGGIGKSALCKYICLNYNAILVSGKANDMKYGIAEWKNKNRLIVLIDIPRSVEKFVSYSGIEEIKNGLFYCGKYESKMVMYNSPLVVCFANFGPVYGEMSGDRWVITNLTETD